MCVLKRKHIPDCLLKLNNQIPKYNDDSHLVAERVPFPGPDILTNVHPKGNKEIDDQWRAHGEKRDIDKIFTNCTRSNTHFLS